MPQQQATAGCPGTSGGAPAALGLQQQCRCSPSGPASRPPLTTSAPGRASSKMLRCARERDTCKAPSRVSAAVPCGGGIAACCGVRVQSLMLWRYACRS